jgi:predicted ester cyclase
VSEENKAMVRRLVEAINAEEEGAAVEELFTSRAARQAKSLFAEFRSAFPGWHEEIVELVAEGNKVAGRFKCSGTHRGAFLQRVSVNMTHNA